MIVVDSSVWIDNLRGMDTPQVQRLHAIRISDRVIVGDLVLLEILQGVRDDQQAATLEEDFREYRITPMLDAEIAVKAAGYFRHLRSLGITVRKTPDLIIATFCIEGGHQLLHRDRDFSHFETHLGLQVLR